MENQEKKQIAYQLFTSSALNRKQIAEHVGVTEKTLRKWIDDGEWEIIRNSRSITRPELLKNAYAQLNALQKEIQEKHNNVPTKALSDSLSSVMRQIELLGEQPLHRHIDVLDAFIGWASINHPKEVKSLATILNEYTQSLAKQNGL